MNDGEGHYLQMDKTVVKLPKSSKLILELKKEPRTSSKELQDSLDSVKVIVHDASIRKRLGK